MKIGSLLLFSLVIVTMACSKIVRPYKCGPILSEKDIQLFKKLNAFLDLKPGDTYADIGASSGYYNGAMAVFTDSITFYIQDVDKDCLNEKNLQKVLDYYSHFKKAPLTKSNTFHITLGSDIKTNLPDNTFDKIYSNATFHVLSHPDSIIADLHKKIKNNGHLFIRDEFMHHGEEKKCDSKKCGSMIPQYTMFIKIMERNGFILVDESRDFGIHPIYKFKKKTSLGG